MELFKKYILQEKKVIYIEIIFYIIFSVIFSLYRLPFEAILYPVCLCALVGGLFLISGYLNIKKKHHALEQIRCLTAAMIDELPEPDNIESADYQLVIKSLQSEIKNLETNDDIKYTEMIEYYTIWVHQIKTPIAAMQLKLEKEDTALARSLRSELFRIEQYVEMVLAFLRLDSASHDYLFREYSVDMLVRQAVKKFSHEFIDRKITFAYDKIDKKVITDEKWFSFVLEQIISNALKYTVEGNISIYLEQSETSHDVLCIEDTGIGIAPEDIPRIFEKGFTGYNGRTDKRASGIGLYLCKRVCDHLGIFISADSKIGKGTVIRLDLHQYKVAAD